MSSMIGSGFLSFAFRAATTSLTPVEGSSLTTSWFGSGMWLARQNARRGGCLKTSRSSVCVAGRRLPVRTKNGTPAQRQLSMSSRSAAYVSVWESGATPSISR
jgi:hypothetical protein